MVQLHEVKWDPDHKTARTGNWVLDTGVMEHGAPLVGVSIKDGVTNGVGRVSGGNKQGRKHKLCLFEMQTRGSTICRTLDGSTPEGSAIGFDMGIITDAMR